MHFQFHAGFKINWNYKDKDYETNNKKNIILSMRTNSNEMHNLL